MIKRILVGLGGTPYGLAATRRAIELARIHGAQLTGVTVLDPSRLTEASPRFTERGWAPVPLDQQGLRVTQESVDAAISRFERRCAAESVPCSVLRETGDPFEKLTEACRYHDLTILGLRGLFAFGIIPEPREGIYRLLARGVYPILSETRECNPVRKAFIAYSGSNHSAHAMQRFVQLRLWPDMTLRVACFEKSREESDPLLGQAAAFCEAHGLSVETERSPLSPREGILARAQQWGADMIVLSANLRSYLLRKVLGDTAAHVIQHADRPLFLSF